MAHKAEIKPYKGLFLYRWADVHRHIINLIHAKKMKELTINTADNAQIVLAESEHNGSDVVALDVLNNGVQVFAHLTPKEAVCLASGLLQYASEYLKG